MGRPAPSPVTRPRPLLALLLLGGVAAAVGTLRLVWVTAQLGQDPPKTPSPVRRFGQSTPAPARPIPRPRHELPVVEAPKSPPPQASESPTNSPVGESSGAVQSQASAEGSDSASEASQQQVDDKPVQAETPAPTTPVPAPTTPVPESSDDTPAPEASKSDTGGAKRKGKFAQLGLVALTAEGVDVLGITPSQRRTRDVIAEHAISLLRKASDTDEEAAPTAHSSASGGGGTRGRTSENAGPRDDSVAAAAVAAIRRVEWKGPRGKHSGLKLSALVAEGADVLGLYDAHGARAAREALERAFRHAMSSAAEEADDGKAAGPNESHGPAPPEK
eukprot:TRINITY_DN13839_c0_g1_i1.p1 TRINITY_DN13839_c0_g1~~TRINITY_DN13839_c0_g1_i1.p1  ORF type:complete len:332 (+),score=62.41 TRINITY_DN13839_c0_g1_i1:188-1183(+)